MAVNDLRYAARQVRRHPLFAIVVVATLALGIGPNTALFSLVYGIMLRPLPYHDPRSLVRPMWEWAPGEEPSDALTATQYSHVKEHNRVLSGISAYSRMGAGFNVRMSESPDPIYTKGQSVSADLFSLLGVSPTLGRTFSAEDDRPGTAEVVIISDHLWRVLMNSDRQAIGQPIFINGIPHTVVGIMPPRFSLDGLPADLWLPLRLMPDPRDQGHNIKSIARLRPGSSIASAQADMDRLIQELRVILPGHIGERERGIHLIPYREALVGETRPTLILLLVAVGIVLVIAVANAGALFLGKAAVLERELAVRSALGAPHLVTLRPLVMESVILSLLGGLLGLVLASVSLRALLTLAPATIPHLTEVRLDGRILTATVGLSLLIGLTSCLPSLFRVLRRESSTSLHAWDTLRPLRQRARAVLVSTQLGLALVLLTASFAVLRTLRQLWKADLGFSPEHVWVVQMSLPPEQYPSLQDAELFTEEVRRRFEELGSVSAVATTSSLPLERGLNTWLQTISETGERVGKVVEFRAVSPGYFQILGIQLLRGRVLLESDRPGTPEIGVMNATAANAFWPQQEGVGRMFWISGRPVEVVGIVADVREFGFDAPAPPVIYVPSSQVPDAMSGYLRRAFPVSWILKSRSPLTYEAIRRTVERVDASQPVISVKPLVAVVGTWLGPRRFVGALLNTFSILAVILAAVGVYGIISYSVSQRRRELGVRAALGAERSAIIMLVLREGLRLAGIGAVLGLLLTLGFSRLLQSSVLGLEPLNAMVVFPALAGLLAIAIGASWVPALRGANADPIEVIRSE